MTFKKILCPVDFSDGAREGMRVAAELARGSRATLVLIYVWQPQAWMTDYFGIQLSSDALVEAQKAEQTKLAAWKADAQELGAAEVVTELRRGTPWDEIVSAAHADPTIELIVMGTHGRTGLPRALLGSVAERVARHASCSVMIARPRALAR
jgi:nucleotide-binding universal stress UspA family protein